MTPRAYGALQRRQAAGRGDRVRTYGRDRVCLAEGCTTVLSTYNPSSRCALHQVAEGPRRCRHRDRPPEAHACDECGLAFEKTNPKRRFCSDRCRMAAFFQRRRRAAEALAEGTGDDD